MAGFSALTVFKVQNPDVVTLEKLKKYAFKPLSGEPKVYGWVNIEDLTDTEWHVSPADIGEFMAFSLRMDTRKVPAPVLKLHIQEALQREQAKCDAEGRKLPRSRKKELKEMISSKLLAKAEGVPSLIDVAVDTATGLVYVGSTSKGALALLVDYFKVSFGEDLILLPESLLGDSTSPADIEAQTLEAASRVMYWVYDKQQSVDFDGKTFAVSMSDTVAVSLASPESPETVSSKGNLESANAALGEGLRIVKLNITLSEEQSPEAFYSFALNSNFTFSGLKLPVSGAAGEDGDKDAVFLEKMYLLGQVVGVMTTLFTR